MRFRVKAGVHIQGGHTYRKGEKVREAFEGVDEFGQPHAFKAGDEVTAAIVRQPSKWYRADGIPGAAAGGDVVESSVDLVAKHGEKFERLGERARDDEHVMRATTPDLDRMNVTQLHEYAAAEEIDLKHAGKKEDIIARIRAAQKPVKV